MTTTLNKNVVMEYKDLHDYMMKNDYSTVAMLEQSNHTDAEEDLYGSDVSDVNYTLNLITV